MRVLVSQGQRVQGPQCFTMAPARNVKHRCDNKIDVGQGGVSIRATRDAPWLLRNAGEAGEHRFFQRGSHHGDQQLTPLLRQDQRERRSDTEERNGQPTGVRSGLPSFTAPARKGSSTEPMTHHGARPTVGQTNLKTHPLHKARSVGGVLMRCVSPTTVHSTVLTIFKPGVSQGHQQRMTGSALGSHPSKGLMRTCRAAKQN